MSVASIKDLILSGVTAVSVVAAGGYFYNTYKETKDGAENDFIIRKSEVSRLADGSASLTLSREVVEENKMKD